MSILSKFKKNLSLAGSALVAALISPFSLVKADLVIDITDPGGAGSAIKGFRIGGLLKTGINVILAASGLIAFFMLLIGGVQWIMAGGDKEGTEKARKRITAALIGLAIVFSAYALIFIMQSIFGVNPLNPTVPTVPNE